MRKLEKAEFLSALTLITDPDDDILVIHSSIPMVGVDPALSKWAFLTTIKSLAASGKTIAIPTFTLSFCGGVPFDHYRSPSETGIMGDWVLELEGSKRTSHPIYSWAVIGPLSNELMRCANTTTWGDDSTFAFFEKANARIIMLGVDWQSCTQFHRYEEISEVPYRYYKTFVGTENVGDTSKQTEARMFVRDLRLNTENTFRPAIHQLSQQGKIRETDLGEGVIRSVNTLDMKKVSLDLLKRDPFAMIHNPRQIEHQITCHIQAKSQKSMRIALLGQANLDLLSKEIGNQLEKHILDRTIEVYVPPFDQSRKEITVKGSTLDKYEPEFTFFVDRPEDLFKVGRLEELLQTHDRTELLERFEEYIGLAEEFARTSNSQCFIASFVRTSDPVLGNADLLDGNGTAVLIEEMNQHLYQRCRVGGLLRVLDMSLALTSLTAPGFDPRLWYLARIPFSQQLMEKLADVVTGLILASTGRTSRLIVLDLDNTLWGGILGEDGADGISLGGDYPGNAYVGFQKSLQMLASRGIALTIASKNDEDLALHVIEEHPDMVIKLKDISAHRINWTPKWQNVIEIADELNLGLNNVMFIDDNPAEREHIKQQLPMVRVLELPEDPARFSSALLADPFINTLRVTDEDRRRVKSYQSRKLVETEREKFERIEDFYASLQPQISLAPLNKFTIGRATQLVSKTTQFNTTTPNYSQIQLEEIQADEKATINIVGYSDRFSEKENIGLVIVRWHTPQLGLADIDTFLMSCRVLGRGVESGILSWIADEARHRDIAEITGRIIPTERNAPVRFLYSENGFVSTSATGEEWWKLMLNDKSLEKPHWLTIVQET